MRQNCIIVLIMILSFFSCRQNQESFAFEIENEKIEVRLVQYSDSLYSLQLYAADSLRSEWALKYPIYRFDYGDVNGDGIPEVAVGPVKTTRFDPKPDKRLFLFKITEDLYIRPLWLGSRVGQPLEDFRLRGNPAIVRTIEREQNGTYLVAEYRYKGFGLEFEKYIKKEIGLKEAQRLLNE